MPWTRHARRGAENAPGRDVEAEPNAGEHSGRLLGRCGGEVLLVKVEDRARLPGVGADRVVDLGGAGEVGRRAGGAAASTPRTRQQEARPPQVVGEGRARNEEAFCPMAGRPPPRRPSGKVRLGPAVGPRPETAAPPPRPTRSPRAHDAYYGHRRPPARGSSPMEEIFAVDTRHHGQGAILFRWHPQSSYIASTGTSRVVHVVTSRGELVDQIVPPSARCEARRPPPPPALTPRRPQQVRGAGMERRRHHAGRAPGGGRHCVAVGPGHEANPLV